MKNIKNKIKTIGMMAAVGLSVSSCDLEMLPLNEVVLENFWTDKSDVENVVNSCYLGMQENGCVDKLIVWGEVRSDNVVAGANVPSTLKDLILGNLIDSNPACDWGGLYTVINRCNTVLYYAPMVAEKDPNYTDSDLKINMAEAKAIRALCYFYLARTFKDVPFTLEPSIDDFQEYKIPAMKHELIMDSLIMDLEAVKNDAQRKYLSKDKNSGRVTRNMIYALLADMYLWRASDANLPLATANEYYRKCVECCDYVIREKVNQYELDEDGTLMRSIDSYVYRNYGYPLLAETYVGSSSTSPMAYNAIFGSGNSFESIFELTYEKSLTAQVKNTDVAFNYGGFNHGDHDKYVVYLSAAGDVLMTEKPVKNYSDDNLFTSSDYRSLESFRFNDGGTNYSILKYTVDVFSGSERDFGKLGADWKSGTNESESFTRFANSANWIIYRLTDVMLMRAEAEVMLAKAMTDNAGSEDEDENENENEPSASKTRAVVYGSELATAEELYNDAFNIVMAVYLRSNPTAQNEATAKPSRDSYTTAEALLDLVETERHRELLFEGKRYYDLVRRSRREGSTKHLIDAISTKMTNASAALKIKMAMMDYMYMPYAERQLDVNPYLKQNPAYERDEEISKN